MPIWLRHALAVFAGIIVGSAVNMALVTLGPNLIPTPPGADVTSAEGLSSAMNLLRPRHFIMPFLAHALGTLAGALAAYMIAASRKSHLAYVIGVFFLLGGVAASVMIPAPMWFIVLDLVAAYLPMAWVGIQIGRRMSQGRTAVQARVA